jgi:phage terminase small subunit
MALTPKQQRFVEEYLVDLNATRAAERAGYKQPHVQGPRLLENVEVQEAVDAAKAKRSERTQIDAAWVLERLQAVAERCLQAEPVVDAKGNPVFIQTPDGQTTAAYTFQAPAANKALELLAKHTAALERPIRVDLPEIQDANDSVQALAAVLKAVGSGQITPSEGQAVANLVESFRRTLETHEIERRLAALEEAQKAEK